VQQQAWGCVQQTGPKAQNRPKQQLKKERKKIGENAHAGGQGHYA
jgi:hypothetical protein